MLNWEMEIKKWCPAFKILTYYGSQKERKMKRMVSNGGDRHKMYTIKLILHVALNKMATQISYFLISI